MQYMSLSKVTDGASHVANDREHELRVCIFAKVLADGLDDEIVCRASWPCGR